MDTLDHKRPKQFYQINRVSLFPIQSGKRDNSEGETVVHLSEKKILNNIWSRLRWVLEASVEVYIFRFDLYLNVENWNYSDNFWDNLSKKLKRDFSITNLSYMWVKEDSHKELTGKARGKHLHCFIAMSAESFTYKNKEGKTAKISGRGVIRDKLINAIKPTWDRATPDNDSAEFGSKTALFKLRRNQLTAPARIQQKTAIEAAIKGAKEGTQKDNKTGYQYLPISKIISRTYNEGAAIGGDIDEVFYALSYMAKRVTKDKTSSSHGGSQTPTHKPANKRREGELTKARRELDQVEKTPYPF